MRYRSEIDGLRALAVLPVIFYHTGLEAFSGGYVGVDLLNEKLKLIAEGLGWLFFDRASLACNENSTKCAFFNSDNEPYYSDYGHWTSAGAKYFGQRMFDSDWLGRRLQQ